MQRPKKTEERLPNKQRFLAKLVDPALLQAAAAKALYAPSPYHCKENGRIVPRVKPQTPCPKDFTLVQAGKALRAAIAARQVSEGWVEGFPRQVWHKDGNIWYEACTGKGTAGTYHAYPIEVTGLPVGSQR